MFKGRLHIASGDPKKKGPRAHTLCERAILKVATHSDLNNRKTGKGCGGERNGENFGTAGAIASAFKVGFPPLHSGSNQEIQP